MTLPVVDFGGLPRRQPGSRVSRWYRKGVLTWRLTSASLARFSTDRLLGLWWWAVDPCIMIGVYAVVFSVLLGVIGRSAAEGFPLFLACGLIPWRWFSTATTRGSNAFIANAGILRSTPISRKAVVLSEILASTIEALIGVAVLLVFMLFYQRGISWNLVFLPIPLAIMALMIGGVSLILCPLTVFARDLGNLFAAFTRAMWFLSPGLYSVEQIPERYRGAYEALNPFAGLLEGVRRPIYDGLPPNWKALGWSALWSCLLLCVGLRVFRRFNHQAIKLL